jgi:hypothetical protein
VRSNRSSSTAATKPTPTRHRRQGLAGRNPTARQGTDPSTREGQEPFRSRAVRRPGRTTVATHQRRTADDAATRPSPIAALSHTTRFPRASGFGGTCSARLSPQDLLCPRSEDRPALQPACLCLTRPAAGNQAKTHAPRLRQRCRTLPGRQLRLRTQLVRSLSHVCSRLKNTPPRSGVATAAARPNPWGTIPSWNRT